MIGLTKLLSTLLNYTIQDAIGEPGTPSDLELMIYTTKQLSSIYKRIIEWGLYFKSLNTEDVFEYLLQLLYELPSYVLKQIDQFVEQIYTEFTALPDVKDNIEHEISVSCTLDVANTKEINAELVRLRTLLS